MSEQPNSAVVEFQRKGLSVEDLRSLLQQAFDTRFYSKPGVVAWMLEDDKALRRLEQEIDYGLKQGVSTMQGQIKSFRDIDDLLAIRYDALRNHFSQENERSILEDDRRKWKQFYTTTTKQSNKLECMNHCLLQVAKAMSLSLSTDVIPIECITESTEQNLPDPPPGPCAKNAIISFKTDLCALGLNVHAKWDQNRFEARRETSSNALVRVLRSPEVLKEQALEQSEILFQQLLDRFNGDIEKVGELSMIWRVGITNSITKYTILKAHEAVGKSGSCWCRFTLPPQHNPSYKTGSEDHSAEESEAEEQKKQAIENERKAFQNLIATDNGRVGMRLLADHSDVFKKKDIKEFFTFPAGSLPGLTFWVMVFKLG